MKSFEELITQEKDTLTQCVHCGLCLDECPTYELSGDENNSPRGRLLQWRAMAEGKIEANHTTDHYSDECVGCLACESACPANVPYGDLLASARSQQNQRSPRNWKLRFLASLVAKPWLFNLLTLPIRLARQAGLQLHRLIPPGEPEALITSSDYAEKTQVKYANTGPLLDLHVGCLMEGVYREVNFASIRVLAANGFRVRVLEAQTCCGSMHEHEGLAGGKALEKINNECFKIANTVVSNSSGCGLSLSKSVNKPVFDPGRILEGTPTLKKGKAQEGLTLFYDQPCHLIHGQRVSELPTRVFQAIGSPWSLAPDSDRCCGAGGAYNLTHQENSDAILKEKAAFLWKAAEKGPVALVTNNHVCMGQWESGKASGLVPPNVRIMHLVQVLDEAYQRAGLY